MSRTEKGDASASHRSPFGYRALVTVVALQLLAATADILLVSVRRITSVEPAA